jgi:hypothetical protein
MTTVTLSKQQRDALREFAWPAFCCETLDSHVDNGEGADAKNVLSKIQMAFQVLDQIGWERDGARDDYVLDLDNDLVVFLASLEAGIADCVEDDLGFDPPSLSLDRDRAALALVRGLRPVMA